MYKDINPPSDYLSLLSGIYMQLSWESLYLA